MNNYIDTAEVAKIIRGELKKHFPAFKFTVKSHRYSGGSSIRVGWMDGPTRTQVEEKVGQYQGASFDGMVDLKEYHSSEYAGRMVHFGNDFLFCERDYSDAAIQAAVEWYTNTFGDAKPVEFIPRHQNAGWEVSASFRADYATEECIFRHLHETELT